MPARKNRPNKYGTSGHGIHPNDLMKDFARQRGFKTTPINMHGGVAWEFESLISSLSAPTYGGICAFSWKLQKWAVTFNLLPAADNPTWFKYNTPEEAWLGYEKLIA